MYSAWKSIESITNFLFKNILVIKISIRESRSAVLFDSKRKKDGKKEKEKKEEENRKKVEGSGRRLHEKKLFIGVSHEKRWLLWQTLYLMHVNRSTENPTTFIGIITYNFGIIIIIFIVIITIGIIISIIISIIIVGDKVYTLLLIILQLNIWKDTWLKKMWMKKRKVV